MSEQALKIGYVVSVSGAKVRGILAVPNGATENGHDPQDARLAQIGNLVKIPMPNSVAFGLVSGLEVRDPSGPPNGHDSRAENLWRAHPRARAGPRPSSIHRRGRFR